MFVAYYTFMGFSEDAGFDMEEIFLKTLNQKPMQSLHFEGHSALSVTSEVYIFLNTHTQKS